MSKEYIDRELFIEKVKDIPMWGSVAAMMADALPAADVVEVKHGRWLKEIDSWRSRECSVCRAVYSWDKTPPYCPNCGAKMDLPVLCSGVECAPPYGDKEDCELNKGGFCGAKMDGE